MLRWLWLVLLCSCGGAPTAAPVPSTIPPHAPTAPVAHLPVLVRHGSITAGDHHVCAVDAAGEVECWGKGGSGRLRAADRRGRRRAAAAVRTDRGRRRLRRLVRRGRTGCTATQDAIRLDVTFSADGELAIGGPATWPAIQRGKGDAIERIEGGKREKTPVGRYRFVLR